MGRCRDGSYGVPAFDCISHRGCTVSHVLYANILVIDETRKQDNCWMALLEEGDAKAHTIYIYAILVILNFAYSVHMLEEHFSWQIDPDVSPETELVASSVRFLFSLTSCSAVEN